MSSSERFSSVPLSIEHINKSFGKKRILDDVTFEIEHGSFTCLCGPSGCGKTTIMSIVAGYIMQDEGKCLFEGVPVREPNSERLVVFQESALIPWMSLWENTLFGPQMQGKDISQAKKKASDLIELSGLSGFETKYPGQLSGGMKRRGELIRALINEPKMLLLDEPFRGLDAMTRGLMQEHVIKMFEETGITMLLITSELDEAILMSDVVYFLTATPTRVKQKMVVDLPRPRTFEYAATPEYAELEQEAHELMTEEAEKTLFVPDSHSATIE